MPSNPQELAGEPFRAANGAVLRQHLRRAGRAPAVPAGVARGQGARRRRPSACVLALPMILRLFAIPAGDAGGRPPRRAAGGHHGRHAGGAGRVRRARRSRRARSRSPCSMRWRRPPSCCCSSCPTSMRCAGLAPHRRAYGPVRLWGSAAFIVANLAAGYLLDVIAARDLIWLIVAAMALCAGGGLGAAAARARGPPARRGRDAAGARAAARSRRSSRSPPRRA